MYRRKGNHIANHVGMPDRTEQGTSESQFPATTAYAAPETEKEIPPGSPPSSTLINALPNSSVPDPKEDDLPCPVQGCLSVFNGKYRLSSLYKHLGRPAIWKLPRDERAARLALHKIERENLLASGFKPREPGRQRKRVSKKRGRKVIPREPNPPKKRVGNKRVRKVTPKEPNPPKKRVSNNGVRKVAAREPNPPKKRVRTSGIRKVAPKEPNPLKKRVSTSGVRKVAPRELNPGKKRVSAPPQSEHNTLGGEQILPTPRFEQPVMDLEITAKSLVAEKVAISQGMSTDEQNDDTIERDARYLLDIFMRP